MGCHLCTCWAHFGYDSAQCFPKLRLTEQFCSDEANQFSTFSKWILFYPHKNDNNFVHKNFLAIIQKVAIWEMLALPYFNYKKYTTLQTELIVQNLKEPIVWRRYICYLAALRFWPKNLKSSVAKQWNKIPILLSPGTLFYIKRQNGTFLCLFWLRNHSLRFEILMNSVSALVFQYNLT